MKTTQRPRALRKPSVAVIVIADLISEQQLSARTSDLSARGCFVPTPTPMNRGAKVQITIVHAGAKVAASGRVVSLRAEGMGVAFIKIEERDQAVLESWNSETRNN